MSSDHYSILGVTPNAEEVVIRAAYRALMRHYHPDTNPDPEAQRRTREITAAFAVLRDPAKRADYDAQRSGHDLAFVEEPLVPPRPPVMRGVGLASAALALTFLVAALAWPQAEPPKERRIAPPSARQAPARPQPIVELEPESERLARLRGESDPPPPPLVPDIIQTEPAQASLNPISPAPAPAQAVAPRRPPMQIPKRSTPAPMLAATSSPRPKIVTASSEGSAACRPGGSVGVSVGCKNERLATLDRMAAGFFSQSMAHADAAKKELLMSSHTRSAETRSACRSDSCVSDAYLRQMREISAIMEGRDASPK